MIRRRCGEEFWLVTQDDHARLAGAFACEFGNAQFARPEPADKVLTAITEHDRGWRLHDQAPTLSPTRLPLDVFESPRSIDHAVWSESSRLAGEIDPYVGLLVTLHQLHLSAMSVSSNPPASFNVQQLRQQFDLNKFQHAMIERLEHLRQQVGLRIDRPLRLGLADGWTDPAEEQLKFNFRLLRVMDLISLAVCCQEIPDPAPGPFYTRPAGPTTKLHLARAGATTLRIRPWPFRGKSVGAILPYRAIPARPYDSTEEFQAIYAAATVQRIECQLLPD
ncbi:MAG: DUF3891 family protein [Tepidisphaeraceae bacterium]